MGTPLEIVKELYAKLTAGDAVGALALMSDDIEWITMMDYKVEGRGPQKVFEGMLVPAMQEWEPYELTPHEFICDGGKVVSVGRFKGTNRVTGKQVEADYSHIWEVRDGQILRHRQSSTPAKLNLLAILAETATVCRDATHDVTSGRSAPACKASRTGTSRAVSS